MQSKDLMVCLSFLREAEGACVIERECVWAKLCACTVCEHVGTVTCACEFTRV